MNRVEAVERAGRVIVGWVATDPNQIVNDPRDVAGAALDASGYPAALTEAIERVTESQMVLVSRSIFHEPPHDDCLCDDCRTAWAIKLNARFLAEHDETT